MISVVLRGECETFREEIDGQFDKYFALEKIICLISYVYCVHCTSYESEIHCKEETKRTS